MKKITIALTVLLLIASMTAVLASCDGAKDPVDPPESTSAPAGSDTVPGSEGSDTVPGSEGTSDETKGPADTSGAKETTAPKETKPAEETKKPVETEPGHVHNYDAKTVAPTCTEKGYVRHTCSGCGDYYDDTYTDPAHSFGEWTETPASYTAMGKKSRKCAKCGITEEVNLPMLYDPEDTWTVTDLFTPSTLGGENGRIPSLVSTKNGTLIAAIDRGHGAGDYGDVSFTIRRSTDGGSTWSDYQMLIDPPHGSDAAVKERLHALTIDISMTYDAQINRVLAVTSFYPESYANWEDTVTDEGTGWANKGGELRLILRDYTLKAADNPATRTYTTEYYLGSDGVVYTGDGKATEYTVPSMKDGTIWLDGTLYKNGSEAGNIFLYTGDNAGELAMLTAPQLLVFYSDDEGVTWSNPVSITPSVKPNKGERYFGVGPGIGIQTESGRLVVPCWGGTGVCVIYSDDHGAHWKRGGFVPKTTKMTTKLMTESQVVEFTNQYGEKVLKLFGRSDRMLYISTSKDGGESWYGTYSEPALPNPDCQISAIKLPFELEGYEGKQLVLIAGPADDKGRRILGKFTLGAYDPVTDKFDFSRSIRFDSKDVWYSCLTVLPDNSIGYVYEKGISQTRFATFRIGLLF